MGLAATRPPQEGSLQLITPELRHGITPRNYADGGIAEIDGVILCLFMGVRLEPRADPMPQAVQVEDDGLNRAERRAQKHAERRLRPALISISEAADHIGVARSTFYKDFLPDLETVRIGKRRLVVMESLDRLVAQLRGRELPVE